MKKIILLIISLSIVNCGVKLPETMSKEQYKELQDGLYAQMQTTKGTMTIELFEKKVPLTVANFVGLAEGDKKNEVKPIGEPYYNGIIFHRIIKDFMIQTGDPDGTGMGGPGYSFEDEFDADLIHDKKGILSMANSGPNTNGSQFFITEVPTPWLDNKHSIFGQVIEGLDVVDSLANAETGPGDKPKDEVKIERIDIVRKGDQYKNYRGTEETFTAAKQLIQKRIEEKTRQEKLEKEQAITRAKQLTEKAQTTPSGLKYIVLEEGDGEKPVKGDSIKVHYSLRTANGNKIDSSYDRNDPLGIQVGITGLIQGWQEALTLFKRGSKVFLIVPPELGYGARGAGHAIPPNSTLYFDMEILP